MNPSILFYSYLNTHFIPNFLRKINYSIRFISFLSGSNFNKQIITNYSGIKLYNNRYIINNNIESIYNLDKFNIIYCRYSTNQDKKITWEDNEDIAELLFQQYKDINPLSLRFTELHEMVQEVVRKYYFCEISGECSEGALEKIQMTWLELYEQD